MASGDTKTEALLDVLGNGGDASKYKGCCNTKTQQYILDAIDRVQNVEDEVEEIKNNPDVVDIVNTYADLQAYDTSHLTDNDVIRVLADETHGGNSTYYRFTKNPDTWTFIGEISSGGAGEMKLLTSDDYNANSSNWNDTNPAHFNCVALWKMVPGTYVANIAQTDVYLSKTRKCITFHDIFFVGYPNSGYVQILLLANNELKEYFVSIYSGAESSNRNIIQSDTILQSTGVSTTNVMSQDAVTKAINSIAIQNAGAPTTSTVGTVGQLYEDTTNGKLYQCTAVSGSTYTWTEVGAGGGGGVTVLTTDDYNANSLNWSDTDPSHFNCIALWKLQTGIYSFRPVTNMYVRLTQGDSKTLGIPNSVIVIVRQPEAANELGQILYFDGANSRYVTGINQSGTGGTLTIISPAVVDNLTTNWTIYPLSANQGMVLKGLIDALDQRITALGG